MCALMLPAPGLLQAVSMQPARRPIVVQALQGPCLAGGAQAPPGLSSATMTSRPRIVAGGMISGLRPTSACRERLMTASSRAAAGATAGDGEGKLQSRAPWRVVLPQWDCWRLLAGGWRILVANLWALVIIYAARDALAFVLHRASQRLTNLAAEAWLGVPVASFANLWWLNLEPAFLDANKGYQALMAVFFIISLPANILINSLATCTAALVCTQSPLAPSAPTVRGSSSSNASTSAAGTARAQSSSTPGGEAAWSRAACGGTTYAASGRGRCGSASFVTAGQAAPMGMPVPGQHEEAASAAPGCGTASFAAHGRGGSGTLAFRAAARPSWQQAARAGSAAPSSTASPAAPLRPSLPVEAPTRARGWRGGLGRARAALPAARSLLMPVWRVDLLFNFISMPLQALSLAVLPVFWTLPWLLGIQLAVPAAALGGARGRAALQLSIQMMDGYKAVYAWPYVALIATSRILESVKQAVLVAMPVRWWQEVIEVPLLVLLGFHIAKILLCRLQDLLPLVAYLQRMQGAVPQPPVPAASTTASKQM